jgi:hypothetical protein
MDYEWIAYLRSMMILQKIYRSFIFRNRNFDQLDQACNYHANAATVKYYEQWEFDMMKKAYVRLTGLDTPKVNQAMFRVIKSSPRVHVGVIGTPKNEKVKWSKTRARQSGCEEVELKRKVIEVRGELVNLKRLLKLKIPDDVYIQLRI